MRFWLIVTLTTYSTIRDERGWFADTVRLGEPVVIRYEVDEERYRREYRRAFRDPMGADVDPYWWTSTTVAQGDTWSLRRSLTGAVDA